MSRTSMKISALVGALLLSLTACSSDGGSSDDSASNSSSSPSPSVDTSSSRGETSPSLNSNVDNVSVSWNFPQSIEGHTIDIYDQDGMFRATKDNGCMLYTYQGRVSGATRTERYHSEEFRDQYLTSMTRQGLADVNNEESSDNYVKSQDGDEVEGVTADVTYTGNGGVKYKGWFWFRHFGDDVMPVSLMSSYVCPESEYSPEETESLFSENLHIEGLSTADKKMEG